MSILKAKETKFGLYVVLYSAIVLGALGALNFLANRHVWSLDTTANKRFSLSEQTTKVAKELKTDVKITHFNETSQFSGAGGAKDLLDRYGNLSSKISIDYIDPNKKPQLARAAGVKQMNTTFIEAMGRKEEARSVTEEEVTGAIIRALKGGKRTVCWVSGSGEHDLEESGSRGYSGLKDQLERNNYQTMKISLIEKQEIPKECTVLMVAGPRRDYIAPAVAAVKKFVEEGGSALVMLDPPVKFASEEVDENAAMKAVLDGWGVTLGKNLILDTSPVSQIFGLSEVVPLVTSYESHAIVREMRDVASAIPLAQSVETKSADKATAEKLFSTSANSYASNSLSSAEIRLDPSKDKKGPFALAAAGTFNTGKENVKGRFVVTGSSGFMANNILRFNGNRDLALNIFNWLSADEDLISIRPKDPEDRRLSLTVGQMRTLFFATVVFLPLLIGVAGFGVWMRRR